MARKFPRLFVFLRAMPALLCGVLLVIVFTFWPSAGLPETEGPELPGASSHPVVEEPRTAEVKPPIRVERTEARSTRRSVTRIVDRSVLLCEALGPAAPYPICGVDCWQAGQRGCGAPCLPGNLGPAAPYPVCGVDCWASRQPSCGVAGCAPFSTSGVCQKGPANRHTLRIGTGPVSSQIYGNAACRTPCRCGPGAYGPKPCGWEASRLIDWQNYAQGEYCGPARTRHVDEYRLRVDDELDLVYRETREAQPNPYQLNVGDEIQVESATDPDLDRNLLIQPDGTITLRLLGQVRATGRTIPQLREEVEELYKKYYKVPAITISPLRVNSKLTDLINSVDSRFGQGGLNRSARVVPDGTISLPAIGVVQAQGLTLPELRVELREAYRKDIEGVEVIPVLRTRAPRYVYVLGEVALPGRYELVGPTTVLQAISMAGSWNVGAYLRQVVVLRRGEDWRLMATMLNLRPALYAKQPCPPDEIWISDSDIIIVPKNPILVADEFIELVFTRGIYGVFPMNASLNFAKLSTL